MWVARCPAPLPQSAHCLGVAARAARPERMDEIYNDETGDVAPGVPLTVDWGMSRMTGAPAGAAAGGRGSHRV